MGRARELSTKHTHQAATDGIIGNRKPGIAIISEMRLFCRHPANLLQKELDKHQPKAAQPERLSDESHCHLVRAFPRAGIPGLQA
jgi:hypothetical protein